MPTETQKNFKREMNQYRNEKKGTDNQPYFSYIENDFIDDYYTIKKKRRKRLYTGSIISLVIIIIAFYSQFASIANYLSATVLHKNGIIPSISTVLNLNNKSEEIKDYLDKTEYITLTDNEIIGKVNNLNKEYSGKSIKDQSYEATIQQLKDAAFKNNIELEKLGLKVPNKFEKFHETMLIDNNKTLEYIESLINLSKNYTEYNKILVNTKVEELNASKKATNQELLNAFDILKIEYIIQENGRIQYKLKN